MTDKRIADNPNPVYSSFSKQRYMYNNASTHVRSSKQTCDLVCGVNPSYISKPYKCTRVTVVKLIINAHILSCQQK